MKLRDEVVEVVEVVSALGIGQLDRALICRVGNPSDEQERGILLYAHLLRDFLARVDRPEMLQRSH